MRFDVVKQTVISPVDQRLDQVRHDYEVRSWIRLIVTSLGVVLSVLTLLSLLGIITHSQWVNLPQTSTSSLSENYMIDIFMSGPIYFGIFSSIAILMWVLKTRL
jgi:predicted ABC-type exoprotein transport system permease subunit